MQLKWQSSTWNNIIYVFILAVVSIIHLSEQIFSLAAACITTPNGKAGKSHFVSIKNQYVWINRVETKEHRIDIMREGESESMWFQQTVQWECVSVALLSSPAFMWVQLINY